MLETKGGAHMSVAPTPAPEPMRHRSLTWPSTGHGRRAGWLSLAPAGLMMVTGMLGAAGAYDWSRSARIAELGIPTAGMLICSLVASVLAVLALREGDRSLVLLWPLLLGATAVLFLVGEFAVPH
jgi:hypothetical protein